MKYTASDLTDWFDEIAEEHRQPSAKAKSHLLRIATGVTEDAP